MNIIKRKDKKQVYTVITRSKACHAVVKVLNEYSTEQKALNALIELVQGNITEEELLQEYVKKD
jgi:cell division protein FtsB